VKNARSFYRGEEHVAGFARATQDIFILNLRQKIAQWLEKQHSIQQERREGFADDNDAIYAEQKRQLVHQTPGDPALPRQMPIDTHVGGLGGSG